MRSLIVAVALVVFTLAAAPAPAQEHPGGNPGDLSNSCQVSLAQKSVNGVAVRSKVDSTLVANNGAPSTVPAGTKGCAYDYVDGRVVVSMPVIGTGGVQTQDRTYLPSELTGAN
jgi:hypothetical protein